MNTTLLRLGLLAAAISTSGTAAAQSFAFSGSSGLLDRAVPDNDASGVASVLRIASPGRSVVQLRVSLELTGGYTGDWYAYLAHDGAISVLLNRPGRGASAPYGYADTGLDVSFVVSGGLGDIHGYRSAIDPAGGTVTGTWTADGRLVDPSSVLDTSPRSAGLGRLLGKDPGGEWVLFVADLAPGGEGRLARWSVEGVAVPEPGEWAAGSALALAAFAGWRRFRAAR